MARILRVEATGPDRIEPQDKPVFICRCGLTKTPPYCDGAHAAARREEPGKLYVYDRTCANVLEVRDDET